MKRKDRSLSWKSDPAEITISIPVLATEKKRKRTDRTKDRIYLVWYPARILTRHVERRKREKKRRRERTSAGASSVHYFREKRDRRSSMIHGARKLLYFPTWKRRIIIRTKGANYSLATLITKGEKNRERDDLQVDRRSARRGRLNSKQGVMGGKGEGRRGRR